MILLPQGAQPAPQEDHVDDVAYRPSEGHADARILAVLIAVSRRDQSATPGAGEELAEGATRKSLSDDEVEDEEDSEGDDAYASDRVAADVIARAS